MSNRYFTCTWSPRQRMYNPAARERRFRRVSSTASAGRLIAFLCLVLTSIKHSVIPSRAMMSISPWRLRTFRSSTSSPSSPNVLQAMSSPRRPNRRWAARSRQKRRGRKARRSRRRVFPTTLYIKRLIFFHSNMATIPQGIILWTWHDGAARWTPSVPSIKCHVFPYLQPMRVNS